MDRKQLKQHQTAKHQHQHYHHQHQIICHQIEKNKHKTHPIYYKCDYDKCNKLFVTKWRLNKHKKEHDRPYKCNYLKCNKTFTSNKHLRIHYRSHNKIRGESCKWCKKSFIDSSTLRNHIKSIHSDIISFRNLYVCKICNKSFVKKSILRIHHQTHLKRGDRKLFYCNLCETRNKDKISFTSQTNLNRHLKTIHSAFINSAS